jgi:septal ring factor EnvC (AmiA/AmiB activator)
MDSVNVGSVAMMKRFFFSGRFCGARRAGAIASRLLAAVLISSIFIPCSVLAADAPNKESLQKELQNLRQQIEEARTNLTAQGKALWSQQHDLEYSDPECVKLREEGKALEAQLIEKRRQLDARLKTMEPIRAIENQRKQLVENLRALLEKETLILNEITALDSPEARKK